MFGVSADLDNDGDVDGKDVAAHAANPESMDIGVFVAGFGSGRYDPSPMQEMLYFK